MVQNVKILVNYALLGGNHTPARDIMDILKPEALRPEHIHYKYFYYQVRARAKPERAAGIHIGRRGFWSNSSQGDAFRLKLSGCHQDICQNACL